LEHQVQVGDTLFALATGEKKADVNLVGAHGAEAMSAAIFSAVRQAKSIGGLLAWRDLQSSPGPSTPQAFDIQGQLLYNGKNLIKRTCGRDPARAPKGQASQGVSLAGETLRQKDRMFWNPLESR